MLLLIRFLGILLSFLVLPYHRPHFLLKDGTTNITSKKKLTLPFPQTDQIAIPTHFPIQKTSTTLAKQEIFLKRLHMLNDAYYSTKDVQSITDRIKLDFQNTETSLKENHFSFIHYLLDNIKNETLSIGFVAICIPILKDLRIDLFQLDSNKETPLFKIFNLIQNHPNENKRNFSHKIDKNPKTLLYDLYLNYLDQFHVKDVEKEITTNKKNKNYVTWLNFIKESKTPNNSKLLIKEIVFDLFWKKKSIPNNFLQSKTGLLSLLEQLISLNIRDLSTLDFFLNKISSLLKKTAPTSTIEKEEKEENSFLFLLLDRWRKKSQLVENTVLLQTVINKIINIETILTGTNIENSSFHTLFCQKDITKNLSQELFKLLQSNDPYPTNFFTTLSYYIFQIIHFPDDQNDTMTIFCKLFFALKLENISQQAYLMDMLKMFFKFQSSFLFENMTILDFFKTFLDNNVSYIPDLYKSGSYAIFSDKYSSVTETTKNTTYFNNSTKNLTEKNIKRLKKLAKNSFHNNNVSRLITLIQKNFPLDFIHSYLSALSIKNYTAKELTMFFNDLFQQIDFKTIHLTYNQSLFKKIMDLTQLNHTPTLLFSCMCQAILNNSLPYDHCLMIFNQFIKNNPSLKIINNSEILSLNALTKISGSQNITFFYFYAVLILDKTNDPRKNKFISFFLEECEDKIFQGAFDLIKQMLSNNSLNEKKILDIIKDLITKKEKLLSFEVVPLLSKINIPNKIYSKEMHQLINHLLDHTQIEDNEKIDTRLFDPIKSIVTMYFLPKESLSDTAKDTDDGLAKGSLVPTQNTEEPFTNVPSVPNQDTEDGLAKGSLVPTQNTEETFTNLPSVPNQDTEKKLTNILIDFVNKMALDKLDPTSLMESLSRLKEFQNFNDHHLQKKYGNNQTLIEILMERIDENHHLLLSCFDLIPFYFDLISEKNKIHERAAFIKKYKQTFEDSMRTAPQMIQKYYPWEATHYIDTYDCILKEIKEDVYLQNKIDIPSFEQFKNDILSLNNQLTPKNYSNFWENTTDILMHECIHKKLSLLKLINPEKRNIIYYLKNILFYLKTPYYSWQVKNIGKKLCIYRLSLKQKSHNISSLCNQYNNYSHKYINYNTKLLKQHKITKEFFNIPMHNDFIQNKTDNTPPPTLSNENNENCLDNAVQTIQTTLNTANTSNTPFTSAFSSIIAHFDALSEDKKLSAMSSFREKNKSLFERIETSDLFIQKYCDFQCQYLIVQYDDAIRKNDLSSLGFSQFKQRIIFLEKTFTTEEYYRFWNNTVHILPIFINRSKQNHSSRNNFLKYFSLFNQRLTNQETPLICNNYDKYIQSLRIHSNNLSYSA